MTTTARSYMESLGLYEDLESLNRLLGQMEAVDKDEATVRKDITGQREQLARREAEILMEGVEGTNETQRKAALRVRQESDLECKAITNNLHKSESDLSAAQLRSASLGREWQFYKLRAQISMAKLAFMGSGGVAQPAEQGVSTNGKDLYG